MNRVGPKAAWRRLLAVCLGLLMQACPKIASAQTSSALPVNPARSGPTSTLLAGGAVLVAGGLAESVLGTGPEYTPTAETFDPVSGAWRQTGRMHSGRSKHTATLLRNGKVLVVGGLTDAPVGSAELYTPASRTWTTAGSIPPRYRQAATLLADGRALIAGGQVQDHFGFLTDAWIFDPATNTWAQTGSMDQGRSDFTLTLLKDGRVLAAGGRIVGHGTAGQDALIYDPKSGAWATAPNIMSFPRAQHASVALKDGEVFLVGGTTTPYGAEQVQRTDQLDRVAEIYNPISGTFRPVPSPSTARLYPSAELLAGGKVLVTGGAVFKPAAMPTSPASQESIASAEIFDPRTGAWSSRPSVPFLTATTTATFLARNPCGGNCGKVVMMGSYGDTSRVLLYDPGLVARPRPEPSGGRSGRSGALLRATAALAGALLFSILAIAFRRRRAE